jgi:tRNA-2-methylthio-N6-dimethylallyladenosine synthase
MNDELLKVIAKFRTLAKQIHLPLQSGDDNILAAMNRRHTLEDYKGIIGSIRRYLKDCTIFTDIITGFSGEIREYFENTRLAMREIKFNMAYIAVYSPRPGAASSEWPDDVPVTEKKKDSGCFRGTYGTCS